MGWYVNGHPQPCRNSDHKYTCVISSHEDIRTPDFSIGVYLEDIDDQLANEDIILCHPDHSAQITNSVSTYVPVAWHTIARQSGHASTVTSVVIGAVLQLLDTPSNKIAAVMSNYLPEDHQDLHQSALKAGAQAVKSVSYLTVKKPSARPSGSVVLSGQQSVSLGLIAAGVRWLGIPSSTNLTNQLSNTIQLADATMLTKPYQWPANGLAQAVGAATAGLRAAMLTESLDIVHLYRQAVQSETPLLLINVVSDGQTGLADANNLYAANLPALIVSPGNIGECFSLIQEAANFTERYQTPAVILIDELLWQQDQTVEDLASQKHKIDRGRLLTARQAASNKQYYRFAHTADQISPRKLLGQPGPTYSIRFESSGDLATPAMTAKRIEKMTTIYDQLLPYKIHGPSDTDITLVCFGAAVQACVSAIPLLQHQGIKANVLQFLYLQPFSVERISQIIRGSRHILVVEPGSTNQLTDLVANHTTIKLVHQLHDGDTGLTANHILSTVLAKFSHQDMDTL